MNETEFFIFATAIWFAKENFLKIIFCNLGAVVSSFLWCWIPAVCFVVSFATLLFFDKRIDVPGTWNFF